jgi:hypothetical protein
MLLIMALNWLVPPDAAAAGEAVFIAPAADPSSWMIGMFAFIRTFVRESGFPSMEIPSAVLRANSVPRLQADILQIHKATYRFYFQCIKPYRPN